MHYICNAATNTVWLYEPKSVANYTTCATQKVMRKIAQPQNSKKGGRYELLLGQINAYAKNLVQHFQKHVQQSLQPTVCF